ncbi:MAG: DUF4625 domain-containing protein [Flavobacteriales bacterium]
MKSIFKIFIITCVFVACSNEGEPPTINTLTILNQDSQILKEEGAQLQFVYSFSDDNGLNQFRVSVIDDFEDARLSSAPWNFDNDYSLSGLSVSDTLKITLPYPDLEPGKYKLTVILQDIDQEETTLSRTFNIIE